MEDKNQIRLHKIPLGPFLDALLELYNEGLDYVDLVATPDEQQDTIGILFTQEYMSKEMRDQYGDITDEIADEILDRLEKEQKSKKIDLSDNNDLNQLI
jgi:hypothetical protein